MADPIKIPSKVTDNTPIPVHNPSDELPIDYWMTDAGRAADADATSKGKTLGGSDWGPRVSGIPTPTPNPRRK